ncbi:hypothetical protein BK142_14060 [Paenibacillus glucanolyticus]|nr:hypothetical protein BK142_14060 [Paenibacillus glucanolyticus]
MTTIGLGNVWFSEEIISSQKSTIEVQCSYLRNPLTIKVLLMFLTMTLNAFAITQVMRENAVH